MASEVPAASSGSFSGQPFEVEFQGLLFDMDGTIIDSTEAVVKHWTSIGKDVGVDPTVILETSHGRRSIDVLRILAPEKATWEYVQKVEGVMPGLYGDTAKPIPGAHSLLESLSPSPNDPSKPKPTTSTSVSALSPPTPCPWAIVTSGSRPLVSGWIKIMAIPTPLSVVSAEDVEHGKPNPSCYLLGLERIGLLTPPDGVKPKPLPTTEAEIAKEEEILKEGEGDYGHKNEHVLVLEDAPAGIRAGKAAGCKVLAVVTSHTVDQVLAAGPDWVVQDLRSVRVVKLGGDGVQKGVRLEIKDTWVRN